MIRFDKSGDKNWVLVVIDNRMCVGSISAPHGRFLIAQNPKDLIYDGQIQRRDIEAIAFKMLEVETFGGLVECQKCAGSPFFPEKFGNADTQEECDDPIHSHPKRPK